jgi:hypothetical protein
MVLPLRVLLPLVLPLPHYSSLDYMLLPLLFLFLKY